MPKNTPKIFAKNNSKKFKIFKNAFKNAFKNIKIIHW
jgi:hypothetical protein